MRLGKITATATILTAILMTTNATAGPEFEVESEPIVDFEGDIHPTVGEYIFVHHDGTDIKAATITNDNPASDDEEFDSDADIFVKEEPRSIVTGGGIQMGHISQWYEPEDSADHYEYEADHDIIDANDEDITEFAGESGPRLSRLSPTSSFRHVSVWEVSLSSRVPLYEAPAAEGPRASMIHRRFPQAPGVDNPLSDGEVVGEIAYGYVYNTDMMPENIEHLQEYFMICRPGATYADGETPLIANTMGETYVCNHEELEWQQVDDPEEYLGLIDTTSLEAPEVANIEDTVEIEAELAHEERGDEFRVETEHRDGSAETLQEIERGGHTIETQFETTGVHEIRIMTEEDDLLAYGVIEVTEQDPEDLIDEEPEGQTWDEYCDENFDDEDVPQVLNRMNCIEDHIIPTFFDEEEEPQEDIDESVAETFCDFLQIGNYNPDRMICEAS